MSTRQTKSNILVIGSTGILGSKILSELINNSRYNIGVLIRSSEKKDQLLDLYGDIMTFFNGSVMEKSSLVEPILWSDVVINVSGKVSYHKKDKNLLHEIHVIGVGNIIDVCENFEKRLIHTSSIAVYGWSKLPKPFKEEDSDKTDIKKTKSAYYITKSESDKMVQKASIKRIILRPSSIIAKKNGTAVKFLSLIKNGIFIKCTGGASLASCNDITKVYISCIELILGNDNKDIRIFNLGGNNIAFNTLNKFYLKKLSKNALKIPYIIIRLMSYILEKILLKSPLTTESARISGGYSYVDSHRAIQELGYKITPFELGIQILFD